MKGAHPPASNTYVIRVVPFSLKKCRANMHELERSMLLYVSFLYLNTAFGCELLGRFDMPSLFKQGDIMIGGIFPVFNKDISSTSTFERHPPGVKCAG